MTQLDPWGSEAIQNYAQLFKEFGLKEFPKEWNPIFKHYLFDRGLILAHRDFEKVVERIKQKKPFVNMTGIAASGRAHFGHKVDMDLFKLFKELGGKNYFCVADIDGFVSRPDEKVGSLNQAREFAVDNLANALALGINKKDIYVQSQQPPEYYTFAFELSKKITKNMYEAIYGEVNLGKVSAVLLQVDDILHPQLPSFEGKMPSVTGIGLEQDPHARLTRDLSRRTRFDLEVPGFLYFKHQPGLTETGKMSSSLPDTAIFMADSMEEMNRKINKSWTGGRNSVEEQRKLGGRAEMCPIYFMQTFHNPNDKQVKKVWNDCKGGKMLCGECKLFLKESYLAKFLETHHKKLEKFKPVAEEMIYGKERRK